MMQQTDAFSLKENAIASKTHTMLRSRPRLVERLIESFLFLAAAVSILVTIGIVYELGVETWNFFGRINWEDTNKQLAQPVGPGDATLIVTASGSNVPVDAIIRVDEEMMQVTAVDGSRLTVIRGLDGTTPVSHKAKLDIFEGKQVSLFEFLTKTKWEPQIGNFGVLPLLNATLMTSAIAMMVALPLGLAVAVYLSEYASRRARAFLKPILEILAGIPTVVYGYFALTFMTPLLRLIFGKDVVQIYNTASAGIVIGILVIPLVSSMSEDALSAVPRSLREAAYALGATKLETAVQVVLPAATSGIAAAFIVAISRAIGETMIVAIAAGAGPNFTFNPFESAETMTGHIVRISGGDLSYDSIDYNSIFAIGLALFIITLSLNIISRYVVAHFREEYE